MTGVTKAETEARKPGELLSETADELGGAVKTLKLATKQVQDANKAEVVLLWHEVQDVRVRVKALADLIGLDE